MTKRVGVYIDGFNLYYGLRTATKRRDLWLDLEGLFGAAPFVGPGEHLEALHYFTARVHGEHPAERQEVYLRALRAHGAVTQIHRGRFQERMIRCARCGARPMVCSGCRAEARTFEEKESDVSLAVQIVQDAALNRYDRAVLVSADSDMCPAVKSARVVAPDKPITVVFPPERSSSHLRAVADGTLFVRKNAPTRHQLPAKVVLETGVVLTRPAHWS